MNGHEKTDETESSDNQNAVKNILVVGDWFIDEHWVTGTHRSSTASRTGSAHYRALHKPESTVQSFCGAGRTASLLYQVGKQEDPQYTIHGIGIWHKNDTGLLRAMFEPENLQGRNHFTLCDPKLNDKNLPNVQLYNLQSILEKKRQAEVCTTRIIRVYHTTEGKYAHPYYRIDWELPSPAEWIGPSEGHLLENLESNAERLPDDGEVDVVVVKDLLRGVVSSGLIRFLVEKHSKAQWFISTKAWNPPWFAELRNLNPEALQLLLIPQVAAEQAVRTGLLSRWLTQRGCPTERAINLIDEIRNVVGDEHKNLKIVVLPRGFSLLAYAPTPKAKNHDGTRINCYVQPEASVRSIKVNMGMASVLLPFLVVENLRNEVKPADLKLIVEKALSDTRDFVKHEGERVRNPESWRPISFEKKQTTDSGAATTQRHASGRFAFRDFGWEDETGHWEDALSEKGYIEVELPDHRVIRKFQLWRGMTEIDDYVCCVTERQKIICRLIGAIEEFRHSGERRHICGTLVAGPGTGKTHLVRSLAKSMDLRLLPFNITQMTSRCDILDCFDTIVTTQAQNREQAILVFVDEINARLDNDNVYNAFLGPIEDGIYVRGGKAFHIDPCIWLFSGTEDPSTTDPSNNSKASKGSDFVSRLTLGVLDLDSTSDSSDRKSVEKVYQGVSLLCAIFPDVRWISEKVLAAFALMPDAVTVRDLRTFVSLFRDIQYGRVESKNIPEELLKCENDTSERNHFRGFPFNKWAKADDDPNIRVEVSEPDIRP
ncbi:MAG: ATP-binding protein [Candidatus Lernaella stagnicola]|nr:ATP-binding protein [Candidatus Lernaella stagnicola]